MKDRIKTLMRNLQMSQKDFAAEINISEGALSSIFSGRTSPTLKTVNNIHERFPEVNMDWLMNGSGGMFVSTPLGLHQTETGEGVVSASVAQASGISFQPGLAEQLSGPLQVPSQNPYSMQDGKKLDKPMRRIAEIRVFYDDGTFETFSAKE